LTAEILNSRVCLRFAIVVLPLVDDPGEPVCRPCGAPAIRGEAQFPVRT